MAALEWLHGTKATAGGVRNLESLHTLALFFPLLGMAIPTVSAAICYWSSDTVFSGYEGVSGSRRHTPENAWYLEPFAAPANLAFWFAGLGLFLMPYLSNDHLPATVFAVAIYLNLLGACSMSFHMDASATGTWQHVADRFGMFLVFGHLAVAVFSGLWHACWGVEQRPRSLFALIINVLALVYASYLFIYQASIDTMIFLIGTGFVIFSANYFTLAILRFRAIDPDQRCGACCGEWWSKLGWLFAGLPTLITRLTLLGVAFAMNMSSATARDTAARTSDPVTGIELRAQHDMLHGTWHFAVAVVIMGMGLALLEGLSVCSQPHPSTLPPAPASDRPASSSRVSAGLARARRPRPPRLDRRTRWQ